MLFCRDVLLPFSHIPRCIHAKTPDFPRLFEPRESLGFGILGILESDCFQIKAAAIEGTFSMME